MLCPFRVFCENDECAVSQLSPKIPDHLTALTSLPVSPSTLSLLSQHMERRWDSFWYRTDLWNRFFCSAFERSVPFCLFIPSISEYSDCSVAIVWLSWTKITLWFKVKSLFYVIVVGSDKKQTVCAFFIPVYQSDIPPHQQYCLQRGIHHFLRWHWTLMLDLNCVLQNCTIWT